MKNRKKIWAVVIAVMLLLGVVPQGSQEFYTGAVQVQAAVSVAAPVLVSVKPVNTQTLAITWKAAAGADGYQVYRWAPWSGSWEKVKVITNGKTVQYKDTGLLPGQKYTYTVRAYKTVSGKKIWSSYNKKGLSGVTKLAAPVLGSAYAVDQSVLLSWSDVDGADGYYIYEKVNGKWKKIKDYPAERIHGLSYELKTDSSAVGRVYTVRAYSINDKKYTYSGYNTKGVTAQTKLQAPVITDAKLSGNAVRVDWQRVTGATEYEIYRGTTTSNMKKVSSQNDTSYWDYNLETGTTYYYKVRTLREVVGSTSRSGFSSVKKVVVPNAGTFTPEKMAAMAWLAIDWNIFWDRPGEAAVTKMEYGTDGNLYIQYTHTLYGKKSTGKAIACLENQAGEATRCFHYSIPGGKSVSLKGWPSGQKYCLEKNLNITAVKNEKELLKKENIYSIMGGREEPWALPALRLIEISEDF